MTATGVGAGRYEARTYGGWRQSRGLGLFGMTAVETAIVAFGVFVALGSLGWARQVFVPAIGFALLAVGLVVRVEGHAIWTLIWSEAAWLIGRAVGRGRYEVPLIVEGEID